jgi:hypothetical protein
MNVIDSENFQSVRVTQNDPLIVDVSEATNNTIVYRFESDKPFSYGTAILSQDDAAVTVSEAPLSGTKYVWSAKSQFTENSKLVIKSSSAEGIIVNGKAVIYAGPDASNTIPLLTEVAAAFTAGGYNHLFIAVGAALVAFLIIMIINSISMARPYRRNDGVFSY